MNGDDVGEKTFSIPDGVDVPEGLAEGDQAAVVMKDGEVQHVVPGGFPFFPGLLPGGLGPLNGGFKRPFGAEGNADSMEIISGTVSSVSADEITLDLPDDQGQKSFPIADGVEVPEGLEAGEQATVVVQDGEVAKVVEGGLSFDDEFKLPFDGEAPFPHPFRDGSKFPFGCPCEEPAPERQEAAPEL